MHNTTLTIEDGWGVHLSCSLLNNDTVSDLLGISVSALFDAELKGIAGVIYSIFSTQMRVGDWCSPDLIGRMERHELDFVVEVTSERRLVCL
jgi:hypothetical protein